MTLRSLHVLYPFYLKVHCVYVTFGSRSFSLQDHTSDDDIRHVDKKVAMLCFEGKLRCNYTTYTVIIRYDI